MKIFGFSVFKLPWEKPDWRKSIAVVGASAADHTDQRNAHLCLQVHLAPLFGKGWVAHTPDVSSQQFVN